MALRLRLSLKPIRGDRPDAPPLHVTAIVNTGYESSRPELSLPAGAAQSLGLWPVPPPEARRTRLRAYSGEVECIVVPDAVRAQVITGDREGPTVISWTVISTSDDEVLINDSLSGMLGIVILDAGRQLWCFREELSKKERMGEPPQYW